MACRLHQSHDQSRAGHCSHPARTLVIGKERLSGNAAIDIHTKLCKAGVHFMSDGLHVMLSTRGSNQSDVCTLLAMTSLPYMSTMPYPLIKPQNLMQLHPCFSPRSAAAITKLQPWCHLSNWQTTSEQQLQALRSLADCRLTHV